MSDLFNDGDGTPLDPDEREGLKVPWVTFRLDLNKVEQDNIAKALVWLRREGRVDLLNATALCDLHRRMFGDVWSWAGHFRKSAKNIGVDAMQISVELRKACDDTAYWMENDTFGIDEIAARFHHRLVWIHPFPNGNGRWARLAADGLLRSQGVPPFSWGRKSLGNGGAARTTYIAALRAADNQDFEPLKAFARS